MREKLVDSVGGLRLRFVTAIVAAAIVVLAPASSAGASVTIGQIAPENPPSTCAGGTGFDFAQPTVTSGNSYVVPATVRQGAITSWSHSAFNGAGQEITMKVWRQVSGLTYRAVGRDGPRTPNGGVVNTFSGISIPVQPGDVLGLNVSPASSSCLLSAPGETFFFSNGNAADGQDVTFDTLTDFRANILAVVTPLNAFTLGETTRNKKKGTATVTVNNLPNPGDLSASGAGVQAAGVATISKAVTPGTASLLIKATGKKKQKLKRRGKANLAVAITYTPTGGNPGTQSTNLKLRKKLKKKL